MEEIIKLETMFGKRHIPKDSICRALAVIAGMILLCLCVENQSIRYRKAAVSDGGNAERCLYAGGIPVENAELYLGITKEIDLPNYGIDMYHPELDMTKYVSTGRIADEIDETKGLTAKTDYNAVFRYPAVTHPADAGMIKNDLSVSDSAGKNPADSAADNNTTTVPPVTETPAVEIVTTVLVTAYGNGGIPEIAENTYEIADFTIEALGTPERLGKLFTGWYEDAEGTIPFDGLREDTESLKLYAGWSEFPGFISNDSGYIIGCTGEEEAVFGGLLVLPFHKSCTGIEKGALDGQEYFITDIYIPANITYIEPGTFDGLAYLMYIQVDEGNPVYFSEKGILYDRAGNMIAYPAGR